MANREVNGSMFDALFWSKRGDVACRIHAPDPQSDRWNSEVWCQIPVEANGRHGLEYQCPRCAPDGRSHRRVSNGDQRRFGSSRVDTEPTQVNS